jgi:queuosine precursor transporter
MNLDVRTRLFVILGGIFITCLLVGDLIGGKLVQLQLGSMTFVTTVGMVAFPITFVLTDLLNEFYGKRAARFITLVGFFMVILTLGIVWVSVELPWAPFTLAPEWGGVNRASYENVLASSWRILIASAIAYLIAQLLDIGVFHLLKRATANRFLWLRATGSTVVSQLVDTIVIQFLAFYGLMPTRQIVAVVLTNYLLKVAIAIGLTPMIYAGHAVLERRLGLEPVRLGADGDPEPRPAPIPPA